MSKESYARGFCKAAAEAGVDPVALMKFAQDTRNPAVANQGSINKSLEELRAFGDWANKQPSAIISTGGPRVVSAPEGHEFARLGNALARRASTAGKVNAITPATMSADQIINAAKRVGWTPRPASTAAGVAKLGR